MQVMIIKEHEGDGWHHPQGPLHGGGETGSGAGLWLCVGVGCGGIYDRIASVFGSGMRLCFGAWDGFSFLMYFP